MAKSNNPLGSEAGDTLQQAIEESLSKIPTILFEQQIVKKFKKQGINPPKGLAREIAEHFLSGNNEPFSSKKIARGKDVKLKIDNSDLEELLQASERFKTAQLPELFSSMASNASKRTLKILKERWPEEQRLQEEDIAGFRERMELRWGKPLAQLQMLLTMSRELCQTLNSRKDSVSSKNKQSRKLLIRLLVRACQVTDEILCLLQNGFADGAMARWRTLHEIAVVAGIILQHGDEISRRYIAHQHVESKRAMDKYLACSPQLGYKPLSAKAQAKIQKAFDKAISEFGTEFKSDYGWAAFHLKKKRPTFTNIEEAAGRAEMRSHYQMGNDNVHAGIKSMYVRLGLLGRYEGLLSGRSNAGLTEPGQNAAHTLTQLVVLVCSSEPIFDDYVVTDMLMKLRDEIPRSFARVDAQLLREDKDIRRNSPDDSPRPA